MARKNIMQTAKIVGGVILALSAIGFVEKKQKTKPSLDVEITINNQQGNFFISKEDIQTIITNGFTPLLGENVPGHVLHEMEQRLINHQFIESAEVYKNLKGKLVVQVDQSVPVARLLHKDKPDAYLTDEGQVIPTSEQYAARVTLISGPYNQRMIEEGNRVTAEGQKILNLIRYAQQNEFWKAQIAQLDISKEGDITIYPQVGKQYLEFGKAENLADKFQRLELFYHQILPTKGWNEYERVNVQYQDQIICE
jgi:cell division protein FtsQ